MRNRRVHFVFVHGVDMDRMVRSWWEVYDSRKDQSIVVVVVTAVTSSPLVFSDAPAVVAAALTSNCFKLSPSFVAIDSVMFPTNKPSMNTF